MRAVQTPRHPNRQAFARVLVDHHQQPQTAPIVRPGFAEIVAPDVIAMLWAQSDAGAVVQPQPPTRLVFGGYFQTLPPPDALHPILADLPSGLLQERRDSSIAKSTVVASQR